MTAAMLKKLYDLNKGHSTISFVRRGVQYTVEPLSSKVVQAFPYLQARIPLDDIGQITGTAVEELVHLKEELRRENLVEEEEGAGPVNGRAFYARFREFLPDWMREAFSAPYWEVMLSGKGSKQLYIGYLLELYHYTRNANRHMPLVVAACPSEWKEVKRMLATHYFEEWNHYDFFACALIAMGIPKSDVEASDPLPSTLEMSNFMRQAARTSTLCYAICSAILEGTTEDSGNYGEYFRRIAPHYGIPDKAIQPLFDHLALDGDYNHSSLFEQICEQFPEISRREAERAMSFGRQMIDHIYLWTEHIHQYYGRSGSHGVRRKFDLARD
jgi:pyrroloquinoline quinone (PQQ) biosynthesis protein C